MKLSKLYCNQPQLFKAIPFKSGLNVILAEIRLPENKDKDTHNLGKTTLARLLDFCFLQKRNQDFFLFKHSVFNEFVFFLEIKVKDNQFITIRRSVKQASKVSFKFHTEKYQNYTDLPDEHWEHNLIAFEKAKQLLDGFLGFNIIKGYDFRNPISYALRIQNDFKDVFQLDKFRGKHSYWKPYLAKILGFDDSLVKQNYHFASEIEETKKHIINIKKELLGIDISLDKIEGLLLIKQQDEEKLNKTITEFDFRLSDANLNKSLVEEVEVRSANLNEQRYYLSINKEKIEQSLQEQELVFNPKNAEKLFAEAGVFFPQQIKKNFNDLISFNKEITEERKQYLKEELEETKSELEEISLELDELGKKRSKELAFLNEKDSIKKYRQLNDELVVLKADIEKLNRQKDALLKTQNLNTDISNKENERKKIKQQLENNIEQKNQEDSKYKEIRLYFSNIIKEVLDCTALISSTVNKEGNIDFKAEILNQQGDVTSEDQGHTYRKLLCIAFDMAVSRAYINNDFVHFIYHDGALETLDNRKKENLIHVMREYEKLGIQQIITLIDSDLPLNKENTPFQFKDDEIILRVHDEGSQGRLFKMESW
ncbi:MAG: DUF2326 domain-containing protein [Methylococcaceae bacterium]|nr:DUF2326 domain-containing protein [Methylococcaceae bacterium]